MQKFHAGGTEVWRAWEPVRHDKDEFPASLDPLKPWAYQIRFIRDLFGQKVIQNQNEKGILPKALRLNWKILSQPSLDFT